MPAPHERTHYIYEDNPAYEQPSRIPLHDLSLDTACRYLHMKKTLISRGALWGLNVPTGFARFYKQLPERMDDLLRTCDLRRSSLQAPVIAATLTLHDDERIDDPINRAVTLLLGAKSFYNDLTSGDLEPDRFRDKPLEMGQYPNLFSTSLTIENQKSRFFKSTKLDQITVLVNSQIYIFTISDWNSETLYPEIKTTLESIIQHAATNADKQPPVGLVTAASQAIQVRGFSRMQNNEDNLAQLDMLKHSFVTLCLDLDKTPQSDAESLANSHAGNPENRWSWQSLQLVVHGNAKACAICNFSAYLDGNTMMRGAAEIADRAATIDIPDLNTFADNFNFQHLTWKVNPKLLEVARENIKSLLDDQQSTFEIPDLSKAVADQLDLDSVGLFVIALCVATRRTIKTLPVMHQFLTMSKYRYMDLTTAVVSTPEVQALCDFMDQDDKDDSRGYEFIKKAIDSQKEACRQERSALSLVTTYSMFLMSLRGIKKFWAVLNYLIAEFVLRKTKHMRAARRDIVISHPAIYPQVSLVGRPGVRLPYVGYFALHYQIWQDKTVITMMPGTRWSVTNTDFIAELNKSIHSLLNVAKAGM